jgi:hypothetical protein
MLMDLLPIAPEGEPMVEFASPPRRDSTTVKGLNRQRAVVAAWDRGWGGGV